MYVIIRASDGAYVTPPGSEHSYSPKLQDARAWQTRDHSRSDVLRFGVAIIQWIAGPFNA